jgi:NADH-quinone oxidoreductase subunit H
MNLIELLLELLLMPLVAFVIGLGMVLMMRRIAARLQRRVGPPFFQPLYDIVKLYGKRTQTSHGLVHDIGIVMAVGGYVAAETLLPMPGMNGIAAKGGLITLVYLMMVPSLGMALGVGQCANPNGSIGIGRALTAMLAYDVPFVIVVFGVAFHFGGTNLVSIIDIQQAAGIAGWGAVQMPLLALAGLFTLHGMLGKQPFEIYIAPAEIATGPMVEMSGKFMGGLFVMQSFQLYTASALYVTLFLGGGENWLFFIVKCFAVLAIPVSLAYLFPRFRTDDLVRIFWKWPVMIGLLGLAFVMR